MCLQRKWTLNQCIKNKVTESIGEVMTSIHSIVVKNPFVLFTHSTCSSYSTILLLNYFRSSTVFIIIWLDLMVLSIQSTRVKGAYPYFFFFLISYLTWVDHWAYNTALSWSRVGCANSQVLSWSELTTRSLSSTTPAPQIMFFVILQTCTSTSS